MQKYGPPMNMVPLTCFLVRRAETWKKTLVLIHRNASNTIASVRVNCSSLSRPSRGQRLLQGKGSESAPVDGSVFVVNHAIACRCPQGK